MAIENPTVVILDGYTLNPGDLDWSPITNIVPTNIYEHTTDNEVIKRCKGAKVIMANKTIIDAKTIAALPDLECICVLATGYNNIDLAATNKRGILVCNVSGYGTPAVAQHVFALLLELTNQVGLHQQSVIDGKWARSRDFSYTEQPMIELYGKTMGIYGLGKIGRATAAIANAFGMQLIATSRSAPDPETAYIKRVDLETLFAKSDVLSLHANLSPQNEGLVNAEMLGKMKSSAYLINTGRGGLIVESDLKFALENHQIAGAGLDVLSVEPPVASNPLIGVKNSIITPHIAWASQAARRRLMNIAADNLRAFLDGSPQNVVG